MALAVCLLFDRCSDRALRALWDRLEERGVPSLRSHTHRQHVPHDSYAVLRTWEHASVTAAVSALGARDPVELSFRRGGAVPAWPGVAAGRGDIRLRGPSRAGCFGGAGHRRGPVKHYQHGMWVPHCSVAPRASLARLPTLAVAVYDVLPLRVRLDHEALVNSATGRVWPLATVL